MPFRSCLEQNRCARLLFCEGKTNSKHVPICGWGCMLHHAMKCFQAAFSSNRVLVIDEKLFALSKHFKPLLSNNCSFSMPKNSIPEWPGQKAANMVKMSQQVNNMKLAPEDLESFPPYLPKELNKRLQLVSPDPEYWFNGQFIAYLLRPNEVGCFDFSSNSSCSVLSRSYYCVLSLE